VNAFLPICIGGEGGASISEILIKWFNDGSKIVESIENSVQKKVQVGSFDGGHPVDQLVPFRSVCLPPWSSFL
jgi:hypothetical protein